MEARVAQRKQEQQQERRGKRRIREIGSGRRIREESPSDARDTANQLQVHGTTLDGDEPSQTASPTTPVSLQDTYGLTIPSAGHPAASSQAMTVATASGTAASTAVTGFPILAAQPLNLVVQRPGTPPSTLLSMYPQQSNYMAGGAPFQTQQQQQQQQPTTNYLQHQPPLPMSAFTARPPPQIQQLPTITTGPAPLLSDLDLYLLSLRLHYTQGQQGATPPLTTPVVAVPPGTAVPGITYSNMSGDPQFEAVIQRLKNEMDKLEDSLKGPGGDQHHLPEDRDGNNGGPSSGFGRGGGSGSAAV